MLLGDGSIMMKMIISALFRSWLFIQATTFIGNYYLVGSVFQSL